MCFAWFILVFSFFSFFFVGADTGLVKGALSTDNAYWLWICNINVLMCLVFLSEWLNRKILICEQYLHYNRGLQLWLNVTSYSEAFKMWYGHEVSEWHAWNTNKHKLTHNIIWQETETINCAVVACFVFLVINRKWDLHLHRPDG